MEYIKNDIREIMSREWTEFMWTKTQTSMKFLCTQKQTPGTELKNGYLLASTCGFSTHWAVAVTSHCAR
jgi:hypothetical protein